ncbi:hypothetical protein D3C85_1425520 [compost metagenome]
MVSELDIFAHGFGEQDLFLRHIAHPAVQLVKRDALNWNIGDLNFTFAGRIFMQELLQQCRFTAAGASHYT